MQQTSHHWFVLFIILSLGSGCAALIYEIVWFQQLQLVIGSSAVSLAVLLGTFMGGLSLGSLILPRVISPRREPFRVYALLELGIALCGVAVLVGMPLVGRLYAASAGHGAPALRALAAILCLLPPTILMGATLPAMSRWLEAIPEGVSRLGFIYSGNTIGAVVGCLLAGFYLLRIYDLETATYVAVTLNAALAVASICTGPFISRDSSNLRDPQPMPTPQIGSDWPVYIAIGLSGLSALAAEVIWTRLLSLLLGPTVYSFSIILACFLAGLGIGSSIGTLLARRLSSPRLALAWCQLLLMTAIALAAYLLGEFFPHQPHVPPASLAVQFRSDVARSLLAVLPAACLWGASFPLALAAAASRETDSGRLVGGIYAANTIGAISGAVATSLVVIAWMGTQDAQRVLIWVSALTAMLLFATEPSPARSRISSRRRQRGTPTTTGSAGLPVLATLAVAGILTMTISPVSALLVAYGRYAASWIGHTNVLYVGEGMNASVAVSEADGMRYFHVSGKMEASTELQDMRLQRMLGQLPSLIHPHPLSILVVGCGAGVTAGSFVPHASIKRILIIDIEPLIPQVVTSFFRAENYDVVHDPRAGVMYDDARHHLLTTSETFDIITSDPIHPWVKGSAALYTKEYFELVRQHLNPNGVVSQWVPLYQTSPEVVKSEIATFFEVFPNGTIWSNEPLGNDLVLVGQTGPAVIDVDEIQDRLNRSTAVRESLRDVGFASAVDLLATYTGRESDIRPWLAGAEINRDGNLRLQYLAGLQLESDQPEAIYVSMLNWRRYPDGLFVGSAGSTQALKQELQRPIPQPPPR